MISGVATVGAIELVHLTFIGSGISPASVEFSPRLTVIYGASDTGKSFVVESIDFALGAGKNLRQIAELQPYSYVLLGVKLPDERIITLRRNVTGGQIGLFEGDFRHNPHSVQPRMISPKHNPKSLNNISRILLRELDLDDYQVRTNKQNKTRMLSLRDLCHLCIIDETRMQAPRSPVVPTGQYTSQTVERSIFGSLLRGEDDSGLQQASGGSETKKINKGKIEVLERARAEFAKQDTSKESTDELRRQLIRLISVVESQGASVAEVVREKDRILSERSEYSASNEAYGARIVEIDVMIARFDLLLQQYDSDLARLDMVNEAGNILGLFEPGVCVFCGAEPEHQVLATHVADETNSLGVAVEAEVAKTLLLRDDLRLTIEDLRQQHADLVARQRDVQANLRRYDNLISDLDRRLEPLEEDLSSFLESRSRVEGILGIRDQLATIDRILSEVGKIEGNDVVEAATFDAASLREFASTMRDILESWGVPESGSVRFDLESFDIEVGGRLRATRGKGMRAVLHSGFTTAFAQYCFDRDLPHPGFIVLDSPVVTYRAPHVAKLKSNTPTEEDEYMPTSVVDGLYSYLESAFDGQSVVVENIDPPTLEDPESSSIYFSGSLTQGRYGLFPPIVKSGD
ncbi:hypothetical protein AB0F91_34860 [Amycolatopsis sp. NPDC023774]|uniref:hypothetical protein n=1 Tax=Amycolatopsis sp. NPDC023774 TaxID=3155015 RepID=UPI0033E9D1B8